MDEKFYYDDVDYESDPEEMKRRQKEQEEFIIEQYQHDEKMMILIFAQWCINNDLNPAALYEEAYPQQMKNNVLQEVLQDTVPKAEADNIPFDLVLQALQAFGNDDLAFVVVEAEGKIKRDV